MFSVFNFFYCYKNTPLLLATTMGYIEIVKILLNDSRCDEQYINMQTLLVPETALSRACKGENESSLEIAELILNHPNTDPNTPNDYYVSYIYHHNKIRKKRPQN